MHQFSALPYLPSGSPIDIRFNRLHSFNFWEHKDQYILDEQLKQRMEMLLALYVDTNLDRLNSPTITIIDSDYSFSPLSQAQLKDLQRYALALMYCSLIKNGPWSICVPEHFIQIHQNFTLTEDAIAYDTGSYRRITNWQSFERTHLVKPDYIESSIIDYRYDKKLLEAFTALIDSHSDDEDYLFRVLEWVRYAFLNSEGYSYESRNVMMATAFEVFFKLVRRNKTENFAKSVEALLGVDRMEVHQHGQNLRQIGLRTSQRLDANGNPRLDGNGKPMEHTVYGWWARDYYGLRSKIVHEGTVTHSELFNHNGMEHLKIALRILTFCFYRILETKRYLVHASNVQRWLSEHKLREVEDSIG